MSKDVPAGSALQHSGYSNRELIRGLRETGQHCKLTLSVSVASALWLLRLPKSTTVHTGQTRSKCFLTPGPERTFLKVYTQNFSILENEGEQWQKRREVFPPSRIWGMGGQRVQCWSHCAWRKQAADYYTYLGLQTSSKFSLIHRDTKCPLTPSHLVRPSRFVLMLREGARSKNGLHQFLMPLIHAACKTIWIWPSIKAGERVGWEVNVCLYTHLWRLQDSPSCFYEMQGNDTFKAMIFFFFFLVLTYVVCHNCHSQASHDI